MITEIYHAISISEYDETEFLMKSYECINYTSKTDSYSVNFNLTSYTFITIKLVRKYYEFLLGEMNGCHM